MNQTFEFRRGRGPQALLRASGPRRPASRRAGASAARRAPTARKPRIRPPRGWGRPTPAGPGGWWWRDPSGFGAWLPFQPWEAEGRSSADPRCELSHSAPEREQGASGWCPASRIGGRRPPSLVPPAPGDASPPRAPVALGRATTNMTAGQRPGHRSRGTKNGNAEHPRAARPRRHRHGPVPAPCRHRGTRARLLRRTRGHLPGRGHRRRARRRSPTTALTG